MEYRQLGRSGLHVSALSLGSWVTFGTQLREKEARACMEAARDAGVNFFDNAEAYAGGESERIMGKVLKDVGWKRSDLVISTKIFWGGRGPNDRGLSRKHVIEGMHAALGRLQLDYVDLVFCHRPDPRTPMEETVRAMSWVVDQGWAFYWGTSEWSAEEIRHAHAVAAREHLIPPTMEQPQYHMFHRDRVEREYAPLYADPGLGTTIWSPLAGGLLTGKYDDGVPEGSRPTLEQYAWLRDDFDGPLGAERLPKVRALKAVAEELGCSRAQLALAWCLRNPRVSSVITGASRAAQVEENMKAMELLDALTPAVMERIEGILDNRPVPAPPYI
ncbi:MAG: aldo/keto reductase [Candidatus Latescibacteria bacterium]|nr:aldo/keto reductase [Candidatus Latescibacterota bacterium]